MAADDAVEGFADIAPVAAGKGAEVILKGLELARVVADAVEERFQCEPLGLLFARVIQQGDGADAEIVQADGQESEKEAVQCGEPDASECVGEVVLCV